MRDSFRWVAAEPLRRYALGWTDPAMTLSDMQLTLLQQIGKTREKGVLQRDLPHLLGGVDFRGIFYHLRTLEAQNLIYRTPEIQFMEKVHISTRRIYLARYSPGNKTSDLFSGKMPSPVHATVLRLLVDILTNIKGHVILSGDVKRLLRKRKLDTARNSVHKWLVARARQNQLVGLRYIYANVDGHARCCWKLDDPTAAGTLGDDAGNAGGPRRELVEEMSLERQIVDMVNNASDGVLQSEIKNRLGLPVKIAERTFLDLRQRCNLVPVPEMQGKSFSLRMFSQEAMKGKQDALMNQASTNITSALPKKSHSRRASSVNLAGAAQGTTPTRRSTGTPRAPLSKRRRITACDVSPPAASPPRSCEPGTPAAASTPGTLATPQTATPTPKRANAQPTITRLRRQLFLEEFVAKQKVVDQASLPSEFAKLSGDGFGAKIDGKSIKRIVAALQVEGKINIVTVSVPHPCGGMRTVTVLLHPSVTKESPEFEQFKLAYQHKLLCVPRPASSRGEATEEIHNIQRIDPYRQPGGKYHRKNLTRNGFMGAFLCRCHLFHSFLWSSVFGQLDPAALATDDTLPTEPIAEDVSAQLNPSLDCIVKSPRFNISHCIDKMGLQQYMQVIGHCAPLSPTLEEGALKDMKISDLPEPAKLELYCTRRVVSQLNILLSMLGKLHLVACDPVAPQNNLPVLCAQAKIIDPTQNVVVGYAFKSQADVERFWSNLEYFSLFYAIQGKEENRLLPVPAVPELGVPTKWSSTHSLTRAQRFLLRASLSSGNAGENPEAVTKIATECGVNTSQVIMFKNSMRKSEIMHSIARNKRETKIIKPDHVRAFKRRRGPNPKSAKPASASGAAAAMEELPDSNILNTAEPESDAEVVTAPAAAKPPRRLKRGRWLWNENDSKAILCAVAAYSAKENDGKLETSPPDSLWEELSNVLDKPPKAIQRHFNRIINMPSVQQTLRAGIAARLGKEYDPSADDSAAAATEIATEGSAAAENPDFHPALLDYVMLILMQPENVADAPVAFQLLNQFSAAELNAASAYLTKTQVITRSKHNSSRLFRTSLKFKQFMRSGGFSTSLLQELAAFRESLILARGYRVLNPVTPAGEVWSILALAAAGKAELVPKMHLPPSVVEIVPSFQKSTGVYHHLLASQSRKSRTFIFDETFSKVAANTSALVVPSFTYLARLCLDIPKAIPMLALILPPAPSQQQQAGGQGEAKPAQAVKMEPAPEVAAPPSPPLPPPVCAVESELLPPELETELRTAEEQMRADAVLLSFTAETPRADVPMEEQPAAEEQQPWTRGALQVAGVEGADVELVERAEEALKSAGEQGMTLVRIAVRRRHCAPNTAKRTGDDRRRDWNADR
eukprot:TRINITY_DN1277_c0_g3_i2.p1 TRINITY_DN1277_c0_g3~~TRINITY_DN1277_c0_g3_i2.p1  ORF type:complete len:1419 (+),score=380.30 TRINITY_DN1277_c0_g3_i2:184-4257(+)